MHKSLHLRIILLLPHIQTATIDVVLSSCGSYCTRHTVHGTEGLFSWSRTPGSAVCVAGSHVSVDNFKGPCKFNFGRQHYERTTTPCQDHLSLQEYTRLSSVLLNQH